MPIVISPGTMFNDTGLANVGGALIRNWNGAANGPSSMTQVLINSSNVGIRCLGQLWR